MSNSNFKITIFGDVCPVEDTRSKFESGHPDQIMSKELCSRIKESAIAVGNLECAITDDPHAIKKAGPVLYASTKCLNTLAKCEFSAFSIANNHIRDCGSAGVDDTINACNNLNISTFGGGRDEEVAKRPYIVEINERKIAFISFAEHEFNAVGPVSSGAALLDIYTDFDNIRNLRSRVDYLVVLYHGGIEYHPYPSPLLQKKCRAMARAGADLILCQHSHCIGSFEKYQDSTILYGQGNSLFGYRKNNDGWNTGLIVEIECVDSRFNINFLPCRTNSQSILELSAGKDADNIIDAFNRRSAMIADSAFIECEWLKFCSKVENQYLSLFYGWNRYFIYLNRILKGLLIRLAYNQRKRNVSHNLIRCESHYEVMRTILSKFDFK